MNYSLSMKLFLTLKELFRKRRPINQILSDTENLFNPMLLLHTLFHDLTKFNLKPNLNSFICALYDILLWQQVN